MERRTDRQLRRPKTQARPLPSRAPTTDFQVPMATLRLPEMVAAQPRGPRARLGRGMGRARDRLPAPQRPQNAALRMAGALLPAHFRDPLDRVATLGEPVPGVGLPAMGVLPEAGGPIPRPTVAEVVPVYLPNPPELPDPSGGEVQGARHDAIHRDIRSMVGVPTARTREARWI